MRVILINSTTKTITEEDWPKTNDDMLGRMQKYVCGYIERAITLSTKDDIFVNEEGLFRDEAKGWFNVLGAPQPYKGNGVVLGPADNQGNSTAARIPLEQIRQIIFFAK